MPFAGPAWVAYLLLLPCASTIFIIFRASLNVKILIISYNVLYSGSIEWIIRSLHGATRKIFVVPGMLNGTPAVITI